MVGPDTQRIDGGPHGFVGGAQDIDRVDFHRIDNPDGPCDRIVRSQVAVNLFAPFREELLRIVQPAVPKFFGQDYRCCHDRTGQRSTSRFIDAGDC